MSFHAPRFSFCDSYSIGKNSACYDCPEPVRRFDCGGGWFPCSAERRVFVCTLCDHLEKGALISSAVIAGRNPSRVTGTQLSQICVRLESVGFRLSETDNRC